MRTDAMRACVYKPRADHVELAVYSFSRCANVVTVSGLEQTLMTLDIHRCPHVMLCILQYFILCRLTKYQYGNIITATLNS